MDWVRVSFLFSVSTPGDILLMRPHLTYLHNATNLGISAPMPETMVDVSFNPHLPRVLNFLHLKQFQNPCLLLLLDFYWSVILLTTSSFCLHDMICFSDWWSFLGERLLAEITSIMCLTRWHRGLVCPSPGAISTVRLVRLILGLHTSCM